MSGIDKPEVTQRSPNLGSGQGDGGDGGGSNPPAGERVALPTLSDYFGEKRTPARAFLKAVKAHQVRTFTEEDILNASAASVLNDVDGARLWSLAAIANLPHPVAGWLGGAIQERLRREAPSAFQPLDIEAQLTLQSFRRAFAADLKSRDKPMKRRAENNFHLALVWLVTQRSLNLWLALDQLRLVFASDRTAALRQARQLIMRGGIAALKQASVIAGLAHETVSSARSERDEALRKCADAEDRLAGARESVGALQTQLAAQKSLTANVTQRLAVTERERDDATQHFGHEVIEMKGRFRLLLNDRLSPRISDAIDALKIPPAAPDVAIRMLEIALEDIEGALR